MHVQDNSCLNVTDCDLFPDLTECVKGPFINSQDSWVETFTTLSQSVLSIHMAVF